MTNEQKSAFKLLGVIMIIVNLILFNTYVFGVGGIIAGIIFILMGFFM